MKEITNTRITAGLVAFCIAATTKPLKPANMQAAKDFVMVVVEANGWDPANLTDAQVATLVG